MPTTLRFKRGTQAEHDNYIGEPGEITVVTDDNYRPVVHDGVTSGGVPLAFLEEVGGGTVGGLIDDFEDGDTTISETGWTGWTKERGDSIGVTSTSPLNGSYSGQVTANPNRTEMAATADSTRTDTTISFKMRVESDTDGSGDFAGIRVQNSTSSTPIMIQVNRMDASGNFEVNEGGGFTDTGVACDIGTAYTVELTNIDYSTDTFDLLIDGSTVGTYGFQNSLSEFDRVSFLSDAEDGGVQRALTFDDPTVTS